MTGFNKVVLVGNLTRDWEIRATKGGLAIGKSSIAVNRRRKDEEEETMFVDVVAFGKTAETLAEYTRKGRLLLVEGRLSLSQWVDKENNRRSKHEVVLESFQFMGGPEDRGGSSPFECQDPHDIPF